ncbi:hypothetical protein KIMH_13440 [Bombiscardovia apis]|uniref:DUF4190 domain-containing protein n=1 Tax=Bombiscardovia apis TaxID=2932182 RepID=A0ABM8BEK7_9BIFI|nr:DUF4190 domain-containing protein [Bombiscardovia apis]BDR55233.1 hypothetical protein KIMH_13440 [Bombiscardovia apis]
MSNFGPGNGGADARTDSARNMGDDGFGGDFDFTNGVPSAPNMPNGPRDPYMGGGSGGNFNGSGHGSPMNQRSMSAMAVSALVLGIIGLVLSFIPIINNLAFILAILGLIFGIVGWRASGKKGHKKGKGLAIAGVVLSVLAMLITLGMQSSFSKALDSVDKDTATSSSRKAGSSDTSSEVGKNAQAEKSGDKSKSKSKGQGTIVIKATISQGSGSVTYGPTGSSSQDKFSGTWEKEFSGDAAKKMVSAIVMGDFSMDSSENADRKVTCEVLVDGEQKDYNEATGSNASVSCSSPMVF